MINSLINVFKRELKRIESRVPLYIFLIVLPNLSFLIFAEIYSSKVVTRIPVAVVDCDNSNLSRELIRSFESTRTLSITMYSNSINEVEKDIESGKIYGAIYIPRNTERNVLSGSYSTIVVYDNAANIIIDNNIFKETASIIKYFSSSITLKRLISQGIPIGKAREISVPLFVDVHSLFNPFYNYENFIVPGLATSTLGMAIMMASALMISGELKESTFGDLVNTAEGKALSIIFGKSAVYILSGLVDALIMIGLFFQTYHIPIHGSPGILLIILLLYISSSVFSGLAVSSLFPNPSFSTEVSIFLSTPAIILSGYIFPLWSMPSPDMWFAHLLPYTYFIEAFVKIYQYNAPITSIIPQIIALSAFLIVSLIVSYASLIRQMREFRHETKKTT
ncbi:MAG: ABC transporter permease [Candidatus Kryptoniota bacterium]